MTTIISGNVPVTKIIPTNQIFNLSMFNIALDDEFYDDVYRQVFPIENTVFGNVPTDAQKVGELVSYSYTLDYKGKYVCVDAIYIIDGKLLIHDPIVQCYDVSESDAVSAAQVLQEAIAQNKTLNLDCTVYTQLAP